MLAGVIPLISFASNKLLGVNFLSFSITSRLSPAFVFEYSQNI